MSGRPAPDLVLRPLRKSPCVYRAYDGPTPIVARVYFPSSDSPRYQHPEISISTESDRYSVTVTFQRHRRAVDREDRWADTHPRKAYAGFMGARHQEWLGCYAGRVELRIDAMRTGFDKIVPSLILRAMDALRKDSKRMNAFYRGVDCEMLRLIVGLRMIGVTVEIYSESVRRAREARPMRPARKASRRAAPKANRSRASDDNHRAA